MPSDIHQQALDRLTSDGWKMTATCTDPGTYLNPSVWSCQITGPNGHTFTTPYTMGSAHRIVKKHADRHTEGMIYGLFCRYYKKNYDAQLNALLRQSAGDRVPFQILAPFVRLAKDADQNVPFFQFLTDITEATLPTLPDVLYCLSSDAAAGSGTFDDFCSDFGCNTDSISDREMYFACQKTLDNFRRCGINPSDLTEFFSEIGY